RGNKARRADSRAIPGTQDLDEEVRRGLTRDWSPQPRGDAWRGLAICRSPEAHTPRSSELPAGCRLDGTHQPCAFGTVARTLACEQQPVRVSAPLGRTPGRGSYR